MTRYGSTVPRDLRCAVNCSRDGQGPDQDDGKISLVRREARITGYPIDMPLSNEVFTLASAAGNHLFNYTPIIIRLLYIYLYIQLAENLVNHQKTKHIDVLYHYIQQEVKAKWIYLRYVTTEEM